MEFRVLGGRVSMVSLRGVEAPLELNPGDTWLLVTFLLDGEVDNRGARRTLELKDAAMRKRISRLRHQTGLDIVGRGGKFLLESEVAVDALRLLELQRASHREPSLRHEYLRQGRDLWHGGPPSLAPYPTPALYDDLQTAFVECTSLGRRLLIVDDRIAEPLADKLRADHECETATSYAAYLPFETRLRDFDLVVVDRHLEPNYLDGKGLDIVRGINRLPDAVPVMLMTLRPTPDGSLNAEVHQHGLAASIAKSKDGKKADLESLAARVNEVLSDGPVELACDAIAMGMVSSRRRAEKLLRARLGGAALDTQLSDMDKAAREVEVFARVSNLSSARQARSRFLAKWDPS